MSLPLFASKGSFIEISHTPVYVQVDGKTGPHLVFINGLGSNLTVWNQVVSALNPVAMSFRYDRPGNGYSRNCPRCDMSAKGNVAMLQYLLKQKHFDPPYILIGHSLGGLYAQLFAEEYPQEVAGMVLVDSSSREETANAVIPASKGSVYEETVAFNSGKSAQQVKDGGPFPNIPLIVITATQHTKRINEADWQKWQRDLVNLSPQGEQVIVKNSNHFIQTEQPQVVINAIQNVIRAVGLSLQ